MKGKLIPIRKLEAYKKWKLRQKKSEQKGISISFYDLGVILEKVMNHLGTNNIDNAVDDLYEHPETVIRIEKDGLATYAEINPDECEGKG